MKAITVLACVAGTAMMVSAPVPAAGREGAWETTFGFVFLNSSDADFQGGTKAKFDSDMTYLFGLDYHYTDNLAFGGRFGFGTIDYRASIATDLNGDGISDGYTNVRGNLDSSTLMLNATWNIVSGPVTPYVTGGLGWSWVDTNLATAPPQTGCWWDPWWGYVCGTFRNTKTLDGFAYELGIGARWDITDTVAVHGAYRVDWIDFDKAKGTPAFDGFELSFGWKF